ncbi:LPS assembly protein LptD [Methylomonas paludis]|uniref:LPS-assembly protein LptD n=1 Tax=Methylomonas paludis TaxID=1173101 RepID=A0A975MPU5_9GAMM|nr:LPS assembly protein LptD [Methylomonas paludis]QWF71725.1 LPS assembly protein LptD [Methylomonas paludis]
MNHWFFNFWLTLLLFPGLVQAVGNSAWDCEQNSNGEWTCLNQGTPAPEPAKPQIIKTEKKPQAAQAEIIAAPQTVPLESSPGPKPVAVPAPAPDIAGATDAGSGPNLAAPSAKTQQPLPASQPQPAAVSETVKPAPAKHRVHITENQKPQLQKVEPKPAAAPPVAAEGQPDGWTCLSGSEKSAWNCNLVGTDQHGEAQPVAISNESNSFRLLTPTFSHRQEMQFQQLRSEFNQDPWQGCENWSGRKPKMVGVSAAARDNAVTDVTADFSEAFQGEVLNFAGNVDLVRADQHLKADQASYDTVAETMDAQGNVTYRESTLALASDSMALRMNTDEARMRNALFISGDGPLRGRAAAMFRDNKSQSRYTQTEFTSCAPGNQDWIIHASSLKIDKDSGKGTAKNAWLEFKGAPVIYTPYISFPTDKRRLSGFMAPTWGSTQRSGFYVAAPYYWNIAPNVDTIITPRYFSGRGEMLSNKLRYLTSISQGSFGAEFMPNDQKLHTSRYQVSLKDKTNFTNHLNSMVDLNFVSDKTYFNDLNNALGVQRNSFLHSQANLNYGIQDLSVSTAIQHYQSVDPTIQSSALPYDVLPKLSLKMNHNFEGMPLRIGMDTQYSDFYHPSLVNGQRMMVQPSISTPFESSAGFFIPKFSVQSTQYQLSNQNVNGLAASINRTLPIFSVDSGLMVEKSMDFTDGAYNNIIEPRLFYLYIPRKNQSDIPVFDTTAYDPNFNSLFRENSYSGYDRLQDANQVTVAGTSRYINNKTGLEPLKVSLGQIFYFQDRTVTLTSLNQTNLTSVPIQTSKTSNIITEVSGQIDEHLSYLTGAQWNAQDNRFARGQAVLKYRDQPDKIFDIGYRYRSATANPLLAPSIVSGSTNALATISLADASFRWPLFNEWVILGRWQYSLNFDKTTESFIGLEKENCCWRLRLIGRRYINGATTSSYVPSNLTPENAFFVQLELKGLSGFGDDVDTFLQTNLNGYHRAGYFN